MSDRPDLWEVASGERGYPACLGQLSEPVPRLYGTGQRARLASLEHEETVTIVGSRRASAYGLRAAQELARELALAGVVVVSGMARGIDAAAHRGALLGGGPTIAVLANGPDVVYPPMHRSLYEQIVAAGVVVSEHPPATAARKQFFVERNRIMAALGKVVVIVEAAQPSGSLITADEAVKLGRTVGAVPGRVGARSSQGTNDLIREGAQLIRHATDVLDLLFGVGCRGRARIGPLLEVHLHDALRLVEAGAATVDQLAIAGALEPREAAVSLAHLELLGYVVADAHGEFCRSPLVAPELELD